MNIAEAVDTVAPVRPDDDRPNETQRRSQSSELVDLALARWRLGWSQAGEPFAVPLAGPAVALMLRGGRQSLRAQLAAAYAEERGRAPSSNALADASLVLEGLAQRAQPERLHLRVARAGDSLVLDLGTGDGMSAVVDRSGWRVTTPPVLFTRTALTAALPLPAAHGDLATARVLLNVTDESWPLVAAWLVLALDPDVAHPVLGLLGEQGAGKSSTQRVLASWLDPSPAPLRAMPRDLDQWAVAASASHLVPLDNVSDVPAWLSDALCRAATGDALLKRRLYTDSDVAVLAFRRAVILSSIDVGALRGDLGDRLLPIDLERIPAHARRTDEQLAAAWNAAHPAALAGVLDLTAAVLDRLPGLHLETLPRMADYGRVLAAVDEVLGTNGMSTYSTAGQRIAQDVIDSDPVALALRALVDDLGDWSGTVAELLAVLTERANDTTRKQRAWPRTPRALGGHVRRCAPALRQLGYRVDPPARGMRGYVVTLGRVEAPNEMTTAHERRDVHDVQRDPARDERHERSNVHWQRTSRADEAGDGIDLHAWRDVDLDAWEASELAGLDLTAADHGAKAAEVRATTARVRQARKAAAGLEAS